MISFPASTWQSSLKQKSTTRRPRNNSDNTHGRVISTITPRLYLSDLYSARTAGNLARLGITHIVSAIEADVRKDFGDNVTVMHVPIRDDVDVNITQWFDKVVKFIKDALDADEQHKVLVSGTCMFAWRSVSMRRWVSRSIVCKAYPDLPPSFALTWWPRRRCGPRGRSHMYRRNAALLRLILGSGVS
ncbi:hypothetical protein L210DRAFT_3524036 [Boletus edulis BED1]|uniref:Tyrosine-protein phosphatase domain-containing protein n=1 Tax=Boletus edulis BED1 TaxID=1328754 RepID=A0AAD4C4Y9_BOLED|nr:hypothetical protein L210DRAFT_3524036 [Boletus edulis BED1]